MPHIVLCVSISKTLSMTSELIALRCGFFRKMLGYWLQKYLTTLDESDNSRRVLKFKSKQILKKLNEKKRKWKGDRKEKSNTASFTKNSSCRPCQKYVSVVIACSLVSSSTDNTSSKIGPSYRFGGIFITVELLPAISFGRDAWNLLDLRRKVLKYC